MRYSQKSCTELFVCTAILCWNSQNLKYTFFNITNCTPKSLYIQPYMSLISLNNNYSKINKKFSINGFICSNCTRQNFHKLNNSLLNQCYNQITRLKLINYCHYQFKNNQENENNTCQCQPSIKDWIKASGKSSKSSRNIIRINNINNSSLSFIYILIGFIFLLVIFGGIIGIIFYSIKFQSNNIGTYK